MKKKYLESLQTNISNKYWVTLNRAITHNRPQSATTTHNQPQPPTTTQKLATTTHNHPELATTS